MSRSTAVVLSTKVPEAVAAAIRALAERSDVTPSVVVRRLCEAAVGYQPPADPTDDWRGPRRWQRRWQVDDTK